MSHPPMNNVHCAVYLALCTMSRIHYSLQFTAQYCSLYTAFFEVGDKTYSTATNCEINSLETNDKIAWNDCKVWPDMWALTLFLKGAATFNQGFLLPKKNNL